MEFADAVQGLGHRIGVHRGQNQMPGLGGLHGGLNAVPVANFADEDDLGVLSHGVANAADKGVRIHAHLALLELAQLFLEQVFDGVLDGDDAQGNGFIEPLEQRAGGGALALAGGAGDQQQSARLPHQVRHRGRQFQGVQLRDLLRHHAERKGLCPLLLAEIGAVAQRPAHKAEIEFMLPGDLLADGGRKGLPQHFLDVLMGGNRKDFGGDPLKCAVRAIRIPAPGLRVEVGGVLLSAPVEQPAQSGG